MIRIGNAVSLATTGVTVGAASRAMTVGAAAVAYNPNPRVANMIASVSSEAVGIAGRAMDARLVSGLEARGPQGFRDFVHFFATPDGTRGIQAFLSDDVFTALQNKDGPDELVIRARMAHAFWVYCSFHAINAQSLEALARFEAMNPGRGPGTVLEKLACATHEAWLEGEKKEAYYEPYTQEVHDFIDEAIKEGWLLRPEIAVHRNPKKKFKVEAKDFDPQKGRAYKKKFLRATAGRRFDSGFKLNTVGGEWAELASIEVPGSPDWERDRPLFLFKLQADNVAAVLLSLENQAIIQSFGEGSPADKLQSLIELLRGANLAWRINNPWGGVNSPLLARPFALAEDGGIGIDDILRDARTAKATLEVLEKGRRNNSIRLDAAKAEGLKNAFASGFQDVLEASVDKEALTAAMRINTGEYRQIP